MSDGPEWLLPNPEETKADYRETLACLHDCLPADGALRAELQGGLYVYAVNIPALTSYGARGGERSLLGIISEVVEEEGTKFTFTLYHLGETLGEETHQADEATYSTAFGDEHLDEYDVDLAERLRDMLGGATSKWFDPTEAWFQIKNRYPAAVIRNAYNAERRSERRMRKALAAEGIPMPRGSITDTAA